MISLKVTWKYGLAFFFLTLFFLSIHQLNHYLIDFLICKSWNLDQFSYLEFTHFKTSCNNNSLWFLSNLYSQIFDFAIMWLGMLLLVQKKHSEIKSQFGFALIFAQLPLLKIAGSLLKETHLRSDTLLGFSYVFGDSLVIYYGSIILTLTACMAPLTTAYMVIKNSNREKWFVFFFFFFPYILCFPILYFFDYTSKYFSRYQLFRISSFLLLYLIIIFSGCLLTIKYFNANNGKNNSNSKQLKT